METCDTDMPAAKVKHMEGREEGKMSREKATY